jgi:cytochrome bd-type quinol oxidase subunit 2
VEEIMTKKFWISVVVMYVLSMALGFLVHGYLLAPEYAKLTNLFRQPADQEAHFAVMLLAHVFIAVGFTWVYLRGRENKPFLAQGLRYGAAVAVLSTIPTYLIYLAVQPMPEALVVKQIVFDTIAMLAMGVVVAGINK